MFNKLIPNVEVKGIELGIGELDGRGSDLPDSLSIPSTSGRKAAEDIDKEHRDGMKGIVTVLNRLADSGPERGASKTCGR